MPHSVSLPVTGGSDDISAYLASHDVSDKSGHLDNTDWLGVLVLFCGLLWSVLNYQLVLKANIVFHDSLHRIQDPASENKRNCEKPLESNSNRNLDDCSDLYQTPSKSLVINDKRSYSDPNITFADTLFAFAGVFFSQDLGLTPRSTSIRCVIAAWAFSGIFLTFLYTGYVTARNIVTSSHQVSTFQELLEDEEYSFCLPKVHASINQVLRQSSGEGVLGRLNARMPYLQDRSVPHVCDTLEGGRNQLLTTPKSVLLTTKTALAINNIDLASNNFNKTVFLLKEKLFAYSRGFIFPKNAEFNDEVSKKLTELDQSGITAYIRAKYWNFEQIEVQQKDDDSRDLRPTSVSELLWLCEVCVACVLVAAGVLICECLAANCLLAETGGGHAGRSLEDVEDVPENLDVDETELNEDMEEEGMCEAKEERLDELEKNIIESFKWEMSSKTEINAELS